MVDSTICPNCQSEVNQNFCPNCGQRKVEGRLKWAEVWDEFRDKVIGMEKGLFHTFLLMITKPGKPALDYVNGIRKKYASPIQYYFLAITISFLAFAFFDVMDSIGNDELFEQAFGTNNLDEKSKEGINRFFTSFSKNLKTLTFLAFPFQLCLHYLFFRKYKFSLLECAIMLLYLDGTNLLIQAFTAPLYGLFGAGFMSVFSILFIIYSIIVLKRFFGSGWIRATIAYAFYYLVLMLTITIGTVVILIIEKSLNG